MPAFFHAEDAKSVKKPLKVQKSQKSDQELGSAPLAFRKEAAAILAELLVADAVSLALNLDGRSLRAIGKEANLDPAFLSRLSSGKNCTVNSLAFLALSLGKELHISIE